MRHFIDSIPERRLPRTPAEVVAWIRAEACARRERRHLPTGFEIAAVNGAVYLRYVGHEEG